MGDNKDLYSKAAKYYAEVKVTASAVDTERFERAKMREAKYGENWNKQKVNLNEIIDDFCPDYTAKEKGEKLIFKGDRYDVCTDLAAGYLTIYDKQLKTWVNLDGSPAKDGSGHYKIKKREEM